MATIADQEYKRVPDNSTTNITALNITEDFGATDRNLLTIRNTERDGIQSANLFSGRKISSDFPAIVEQRYRSPVNEDDRENVLTTSPKENISSIERELNQINNREDIHGAPDTSQLANVGLLGKLSGQENVRESAKIGKI